MPNANDIKAGKAYIELSLDLTKVSAGLRALRAKLNRVGSMLSGIGAKFAATGAAIAAPLAIATRAFTNVGDQLDKMSQRTGFSVEALSELRFATEQSGQSFEQFESVAIGMTRQMRSLERGLSTAVEAFKALGLTYQDLAGLSPEQQFTTIADRLSKLEDPTRRAGIAMEVFGRAGRNLIPLLSGGADGIEKLRKRAQELGLTISTKTAKEAAKLTDAFNEVRSVSQRIAVTVGGTLAPLFKKMGANLAAISDATQGWVKANAGLIRSIATASVVIAGTGAALLAMGFAFKALAIAIIPVQLAVAGLSAVFVGLKVALLALVSPIGLVVGALAGIGVAAVRMTGIGSGAIQSLGDKFSELKTTATATIGGVRDAIVNGRLDLAMKVAGAGLKLAFFQAVEPLREAWATFTDAFRQVGTSAFFDVARGAVNAFALIKSAITNAAASLKSFGSDIKNRFTEAQNAIEFAATKVALNLSGGSPEEKAGQLKSAEDRFLRKQHAGQRLQRAEQNANEAARVSQLAAINRSESQTLKSFNEQESIERKDRSNDFKRALENAKKDVADAGQSLKSALADVSGLTANTGGSSKGLGVIGTGIGFALSAVKALADQGRYQETIDKVTAVRGTFNPGAIGRLRGGVVSQTEKKLDEANDLAQVQIRILEDIRNQQGLAFR